MKTTFSKASPAQPAVTLGAVASGRNGLDREAAKYRPAPSAPTAPTPPTVSTAPLAPAAPAAPRGQGYVNGPNAEIRAVQEAVAAASTWVNPLRQQFSRVIVGQHQLVNRLMIGMLANGHILLEGVPGLGKTLALKTLASALAVTFQRIQFTPDMLPADVVGTMVYSPQDGTFQTKHGPVFANLILADEINRAPAKVQSALLEAMQERQVTLGSETHALPEPFLVMATQNPIEQEGTYPLPEAQIDRFMLKVVLGYPSLAEERAILDAMATSEPSLAVEPVVSGQQIALARHVVNNIYIDDKVRDYMVHIVFATRDPAPYGIDLNGYIQSGASPRATIYLALGARANAFLQGRGYVTPQDVKDIALEVLRHRVVLTYEAEAENVTADQLIQKVLEELPVP